MKQFIKSLVADESAQGATEYILMLVIVVGIAMMFRTKIMGIIQSKIDGVGETIGTFGSDS